MNKQNLIIFNTIVLNFRLVFSAIAVLFSTRIVLKELGVSDFGIYNLLVGIVSMLSFLNAAMSAATQRYLSFAEGKGTGTNKVFYYCVILHLIIAVLVLLMVQIGGHILLNSFLNIPDSRECVSHDIINYLCLSMVFTIISVPYDGVFNAHENMLVVSLIGCLESVLKLLVAMSIGFFNNYDKLQLYSILMCVIPCLSFLLKKIYCIMKYPETRYTFRCIDDITLFKGIFSFAGWNLVGALSGLFRGQGFAMLFNVFGSVVVNAAYGIAYQLNSQISFFSDTIVKALRPQITISEGQGDRERMLRLSNIASKIPFLMLLIVTMPIMIETETVLGLWLGEIPEYSIPMVRITLLITLITLMTKGTQISVEAVGDIKYLQLFVGSLHFLSIPLAWLFLLSGCSPYQALVAIVIEEIVGALLRVFITRKVAGLDVKDFVINVIFRNVIILVLVLSFGYVISCVLEPSLMRVFINIFLSLILCSFLGYVVGLTNQEKSSLKKILTNIIIYICK